MRDTISTTGPAPRDHACETTLVQPPASSVLLSTSIHPRAIQILEEGGFSVDRMDDVLRPVGRPYDAERTAVLGVRSRTRIGERELDAFPKLQLLACFCAGTDHVDEAACRRRGVELVTAPGLAAQSVAELTIGLLLSLIRGIPATNGLLHSGRWRRPPPGLEARGLRLGILGYGAIGSRVGSIAEAIGMHVAYLDLRPLPSIGAARPLSTLHALARWADVLSVHVDGRPENHHLVGEREIRALRAGGYLINTSRGTVVDPDAITRALADGHLAGFAADVLPAEPVTDRDDFQSTLQGHANVVLTPHIGASTSQAQLAIAETTARRILLALRP